MTPHEFTNELGNPISIQVGTTEISGVAGVRMHIVGPTSEIESLVTLKEAHVLYQELGRVLGIEKGKVD